MKYSWIYLALGVIVALVALGAVAINSAIEQNAVLDSEDHIQTLPPEEFPQVVNTTSSQVIDPSSLTGEEYKDQLRSWLKKAFDIASNDTEVKQYIGDPSTIGLADYEAFDSLILKPGGYWKIFGNWQDGYSMHYRDGKILKIKVDVVAEKVTSLEVSESPDVDDIVFLTERQKRILQATLEDERISSLLQGKVDGKDYYVQMVRDDQNTVAYIQIYTLDHKKAIFAHLNMTSNKVINYGGDLGSGTETTPDNQGFKAVNMDVKLIHKSNATSIIADEIESILCVNKVCPPGLMEQLQESYQYVLTLNFTKHPQSEPVEVVDINFVEIRGVSTSLPFEPIATSLRFEPIAIFYGSRQIDSSQLDREHFAAFDIKTQKLFLSFGREELWNVGDKVLLVIDAAYGQFRFTDQENDYFEIDAKPIFFHFSGFNGEPILAISNEQIINDMQEEHDGKVLGYSDINIR